MLCYLFTIYRPLHLLFRFPRRLRFLIRPSLVLILQPYRLNHLVDLNTGSDQKNYARIVGFARNNSKQGYSTGPAKAGLAPAREETMEGLASFFLQRR